MTRILVTGAGGFVGKVLCPILEENGHVLSRIFRDRRDFEQLQRKGVCYKDIGPNTDWSSELSDVDVVVHLVGKTHESYSDGASNLNEFRRINVAGTYALASQAAVAGVRRFVFVSSIKVNGERTTGAPFSIKHPPRPEDAYGQSKHEAELALRELENKSQLNVVIVRPPLVYGPNVKGNLRSLVRLISNGVPLPFRGVMNCRSLVSVFNLCDFLRVCVSSPDAGGQTFLVADGEPVSTADIAQHIANGLGRPARLFRLPKQLLKLAAASIGRGAAIEKLFGDLQVDFSDTEERLGWSPPYSVAESFKMMFQQHSDDANKSE